MMFELKRVSRAEELDPITQNQGHLLSSQPSQKQQALDGDLSNKTVITITSCNVSVYYNEIAGGAGKGFKSHTLPTVTSSSMDPTVDHTLKRFRAKSLAGSLIITFEYRKRLHN